MLWKKGSYLSSTPPYLWFCVALATTFSSAAQDTDAGFQRESHTDGVEEKISLVQEAYASGDYDLALSLTASLKETLSFEEQTGSDTGPPDLPADRFSEVSELPKEWAEWAQGWTYCKFLTVAETEGIVRLHEPVDVTVGFRVDQTVDPYRETRVARLDSEEGLLEEVRSQVYGVVRRGDERRCHLVFFADVPANERVTYLLFFGNPNAQIPAYPTDLETSGEGYGLDITNKHFVGRLSRQMGQLERLTYKRQHGLELYAGGKGHGEPPTIDWANDYTDHEGFQKYRIRNWAECPNYEVVQGPLCVRVRRWGFPHSPVHPLFTPSRMHVDQTYVFYAGKDYFLKEGTMKAIQDMKIGAMRDDEWVLSGYSFTDLLWIDGDGKLHEGAVPSKHANNLWGIGFFHPKSRDAFMALFLDHSAVGFEGINHSGSPTLHYHQHGQLWSRYPANGGDPNLKKGTTFSQRNAYLVSPYPEENPSEKIERVRSQLLNPLEIQTGEELNLPDRTISTGKLARHGETTESALLKPAIWKALRKVTDEQLYKIDANVVDMGYVYDVRERGGVAEVTITMPHRGRPVYDFLVFQGGGHTTEGIRERLLEVEGIKDVVVDFTWNPPWTSARLTEAGRQALGLAE